MVMTADEDPTVVSRALDLGALCVLKKPFESIDVSSRAPFLNATTLSAVALRRIACHFVHQLPPLL